jgi:imidazolonepropionase-like amidohydrolase
MKITISTLVLGLLLTTPAAAQTHAITNGRIVTNSGAGIIENGTVLLRDGLIVAVGNEVTIPAEATVLDADGGWITPGIVAPLTQLGLIEVALESSTSDVSADESNYSVALDVSDSFNPAGSHIPATRLEGVTRAVIYPSTGWNIFGGQGGLIDTSGHANSLFSSGSFVFADMSQSGAGMAGGSRAAAWAYLEAAFNDARAYPGRFSGDHQGDALNRYDAAALVPVVRGQIPLVMNLDRASDIRRALRFQAENPPVQLIIQGGAEAWLVADELATADVPVLIDPVRNLPGSFDSIASTLTSAARLHEAGVTIAYTTETAGGYFNARLLPQHAGNAVTHGVPWDAAFRAITLTPAEIFGVGHQYGALAAGYVADVVVWDGDPLEVMSGAVAVYIDGNPTEMTSRQTRLRDRYRNITDDTPFAYRR